MAKTIGLGRKPGQKVEKPQADAPAKSTRKRGKAADTDKTQAATE